MAVGEWLYEESLCGFMVCILGSFFRYWEFSIWDNIGNWFGMYFGFSFVLVFLLWKGGHG